MRVKWFGVALLVSAPLLLAEIPGFVHYSAKDIRAKVASLTPKATGEKSAGVTLDQWGNHFSMLTVRTADGEAEIHKATVDMFIAESGEAVLVVGGKLVNPRTTGEGEVRGSSIEGGQQVTLRPGDVVHIPANTPHQLLVKRVFSYFIIKVKQ